MLPDEVPEEGLDLREFYFDNRRHFWGLLAAVNGVLLAYALLRPALTEAPLVWGAALSNIVMGLVNLSMASIGGPAYHAVVVILFVILIILELVTKL